MSSGSWKVDLDGDNRASKTWSGRNGRMTDNSYSMTHEKFTRSKGWFQSPINPPQFAGVPVSQYWGNTGGNYDFQPFSNEVLLAYAKLADAVRGHSFDSSVFLGEMRQTLDMITGNCEKVLNGYRKIRRGDLAGATRSLFGSSKGKGKLDTKDIANAWIELQYGWKPLISDVFEGLEAIDSLRARQKLVFKVRKTTMVPSSGSTTESNWSATKLAGVAIKATFQDSCSVMHSLGLTNPVNMVWELLPWSFVVDWFVPVGDYLSAASFLNSFEYRVCISRLQTTEYQNVNKAVEGPNHRRWGGDYHVSRCSFSREVLNNPSIPLPSFRGFEKALSLGHLENAAALVRQQVHLSR